MEPQRRKSITYPAEITRRGNTHYVTILKSYMEMLGVGEGSLVDVTISVPKEFEDRPKEEKPEEGQRSRRRERRHRVPEGWG